MINGVYREFKMQNRQLPLLIVCLVFASLASGCGSIKSIADNSNLVGKWEIESVVIGGKKIEKNAAGAGLGPLEFLTDGTAAFMGMEWQFKLKDDGYLRLETKSATLMMKATIKGELLTLEYGGGEYTYRKTKQN